jgi:hypothetical protein
LSKSYPKFKFSNRLPNGDYLTLSVWPGKKDPTAEVLTIQIRRMEGDEWMTAGRLAIYRTQDGTYSQLPDRPAQTNSEKTKIKEQEEKEL